MKLVIFLLFLQSCNFWSPKLGSMKNPFRFGIISYSNTPNENLDFGDFEHFVQKEYNFHIKTEVIDLNEDLGFIAKNNNFHALLVSSHNYVINMGKIPFTPHLISVRYGKIWYRSEIITHVDSGIESIEDLNNKTFLFTNHESASGYIIPSQLLKNNNIILKETGFAKKHHLVAKLIYLKQYDAGATFYDDSAEGNLFDGRDLVSKEYPDIKDKVKILHISGKIPYDPIIFRNELDKDVISQFSNGIRRYMRRKANESKFFDYYKISDFKNSSEEEYHNFRDFILNLKK